MLQTFYKEKRWAHLCEELIHNFTTNTDIEKSMTMLTDNIIPLLDRIPPLNFCVAIAHCTDHLETEEALELIEESISTIKESPVKTQTDNIFNFILYLRIKQASIKFNKQINIEEQIYSWHNQSMKEREKEEYLKLALKYFEHTNNYEQIYKLACEVQDNQKKVYSAILSQGVFYGEEIVIEDKRLQEIYDRVRTGDIYYVESNKQDIEEYYPLHYQIIVEKTYMRALSNLCVNSSNNQLSFEEISETLSIEYKNVVKLIIRTMGNNLIRGVIDGRSNILIIDNVKEKILNNEELLRLKHKFTVWREKVTQLIKTIN